MKDIKDLLDEFCQRAIKHYEFTLEGNYKQGKQEELLQLIYSDIPEVVSFAAVYCMRYNPEKCLAALKELSKEDTSFIGMSAGYAIQNWNNNEWGSD